MEKLIITPHKQEILELRPKKPFKLCFAPRVMFGKSNVEVGKPLQLGNYNTVTPKFYSKHDQEAVYSEQDMNRFLKLLEVKGPREKYSDDITENQRYGWYQVSFSNFDPQDERFNHHKRTNIIVREHLMNYENIR